jgi:Mrp family chromosome partitioning ATPase
MGEISEALRRARLRAGSRVRPAPEPPPLEPLPERPTEAEEEAAPVRTEVAPIRHEPEPELPLPSLEPPPPPRLERLGRVDEPERTTSLSLSREGTWSGRALLVDARGAVAESFRHLALRLRRELDARQARTVAVVSAMREEGKTTVVCNLAMALASLGETRSVALVDLDLRKPSVARYLALPPGPGIEQALRGELPVAKVRVAVERPLLDVYPARHGTDGAQELLISASFGVMLRELERSYDLVVFDTPPVLLVPDAAVIVEKLAAAVAVARASRTTRRTFEHMLGLLPPGKLLGSILNEGTLPTRAKSYGYYSADAELEEGGEDAGAEPSGRDWD